MAKVKRIIVPLDMYEQYIYVYVGDDLVKAKEACVKDVGGLHFDEDALFGSRGYSAQFKDRETEEVLFLILLRKDSDASTIAHEALHITWRLSDYLGLDFSSDNEENQAYLLGYIIKEINNNL